MSSAFLQLVKTANALAAIPGLNAFPDASKAGASQLTWPDPKSVEGQLKPALDEFERALEWWGSTLCNVSVAMAGTSPLHPPPLPVFPGTTPAISKDMLREGAVVRRLVVALMHGLDLWAGGGGAGAPEAGSLWAHVRAAGRALLRFTRDSEQCARKAKEAVMVLHVSKSGGTSMCELARLGGVKNGMYDAVGA
jgi:hypothetical protein